MIYRRPSAAVIETGEALTASFEFLNRTEAPYKMQMVVSKVGDTEFSYLVQNPGQEFYPAGTRILQLSSTCQRDAVRHTTPVLVVSEPGGEKGAGPTVVSYLEAGTDPELHYDPRTGVCHVFYWANGWSQDQSSPPSGIGDQFFPGVDPPVPNVPSLAPPPPPPNSPPGSGVPMSGLTTRVKDLPALDSPIRVGTFQLSSFWVAPWTEAFLYRYDPDLILTPVVHPVSPPPPPPGSPPIPGATVGLEWSIPQTPEIKEVIAAWEKRQAEKELSLMEKAVLEAYDKAPQRLANLSRTTRVLLHAVGRLSKLTKVEGDKISTDCNVYLVLDHPQAVMAFPRGVNKTMFGRLKWSSFIGGSKVFVSGELGFMYPSPTSCNFLNSMPQVDFTVFSPHNDFDEIGRASALPETTVAQEPPFIPAKTLLFPVGFPTSLVEAVGASTSST